MSLIHRTDSADPLAGVRTRRRLGEALVEQGILTTAQLESCLTLQGRAPPGSPRCRLGSVVVAEGLASEQQLADALAKALDMPQIDLNRTLLVPEVVRLLPRAVAERCGILVVAKNGRVLTVATADPTNVVALDDVRMYTGAADLEVVVAVESHIRDHLRRSWILSEDSPEVSTLFEDLDAPPAPEVIDKERAALGEAPIVRLVDVILADAVRAKASDIHVEPQPDGLRIRYRVDGMLRELMTVPRSASLAVVSRLKIVSGLDIAERRRPQDGRARITVDGESLDARVSTLHPVEVQVDGVTQVQVHERSGLTFARGLRSVLRQDPDVVLVGEVRDTETAELALRASLTGHLVLTTLHTNDAVAAVSRLVDMGVEPFLVASSLTLVVGQRLVRRPCGACAGPYVPPPRTLALLGLVQTDLGTATPVRGRGCPECAGTGHLGRTGIFEVLPVTAAMRRVLLSTPTVAAIGAAARAGGMVTLRAAGIAAAARGETTYEEILRVTHVDSSTGRTCTGCARGLGEDMVACPWCGAAAETGHCIACSRALDPDWRICPWCREPAVPPVRIEHHHSGLPRVLVIDDDRSVLAFVEAALQGTAETVTVTTAAEGLVLAQSGTFDAVLIDYRLPDLTGVEVVRLLRADPTTAALALLLFTGQDGADIKAAARHAGADEYLTKPIEPSLLEERLLATLSRVHPT